jgi:hypothetical protein
VGMHPGSNVSLEICVYASVKCTSSSAMADCNLITAPFGGV